MLRKKIVNPFFPLAREHIKEIYTFYVEHCTTQKSMFLQMDQQN
jgi:hypothetical protein